MAAIVGAPVVITYDWITTSLIGASTPPEPGESLVSTGGSVYEIVEVRKTRRSGRLRLRCIKRGGLEEISAGARTWGLRWYSRSPLKRGWGQ